MKLHIVLLAVGICTLIPTTNSQAGNFGQTSSQPLINVSGNAEVKVTPDEIDLTATVETHDRHIEAARAQSDQQIQKILKFLHQQGVKEKDIQTDFVTIRPAYTNGNGRPYVYYEEEFPGYSVGQPALYVVQKGLKIKLTQIGSFDAVLAGILTNGVERVDGIEFHTSELRKFKDQARAMAARAAREKAEAMASELGVKAGKPYSIDVTETGGWNTWYWGSRSHSYGNQSQNATQSMDNSGGSSGGVAAGQISVSATVQVSFLIE